MSKFIRLVKRGFDAVNIAYESDMRARVTVGGETHYSLSVALANALVQDLKEKGYH